MKCPMCKGTVEKGNTNFPVEISRGMVVVRDVPADVCKQCGEVFIPDDVAEVLERIVNRAKQNNVELEFVAYEMVA